MVLLRWLKDRPRAEDFELRQGITSFAIYTAPGQQAKYAQLLFTLINHYDSDHTAVSLLIRPSSCQFPLDHRLNETESCRLIGRCFFPTQPLTSISLLAFSNVPAPFLCSLLQGSRSQVRQFDLDRKRCLAMDHLWHFFFAELHFSCPQYLWFNPTIVSSPTKGGYRITDYVVEVTALLVMR
jgi:hypothetical protein